MAFNRHDVRQFVRSLPFFDKHEPSIFRENMLFYPYAVKKNGEYHRFVSSGLVHADFWHLFFNMFVLWMFGGHVENFYQMAFDEFGNLLYILLYFGGIIMADVSTYFKYRDSAYYRSLGASGAVSGIMLVFILLYPTSPLYLIFLPMIPIPAIVVGIAYLGYSYYASRNVSDNINHSAHLFGGLFGLAFTIVLYPGLVPAFFRQIATSV